MLISGEVPRVSGFEIGFPVHKARAGDGWEPDPLILDDQNAIVDVAGKGLVVVSGCSHAGAVNVLRNAQRLTGRRRVAGFVGGFHLTGAIFEPIIEPTIAAFADLGVERVAPRPCPERSCSPRSVRSCGSDLVGMAATPKQSATATARARGPARGRRRRSAAAR